MATIIGRKREQELLSAYYESGRPEFVAVYGRRRIGKTFLIRNFFADRFSFAVTGLIDAPMTEQLVNFGYALKDYGEPEQKMPRTWVEAFMRLRKLLESKPQEQRLLLFIDEMPCFDTPRSGFRRAFEHFWNSWAAHNERIMLVVCGSATSWMVSNLIDAHGGLHNRITYEMYLSAFTLGETEQYLQAMGFPWQRLSILQAYCIMGGVPYYLGLMDNTLGLEANIDRLFFAERGELRHEYKRLYQSLFRDSEIYLKIIEVLASCKQGLSRKEIAERLKMPSGGSLSTALRELCNCDFVRQYRTRAKSVRINQGLYQLTDLYTLFYFSFCRGRSNDPELWTNLMGQAKQNTWYGLAFERVCMLHIPQIKRALGIDRIHTEYYSWQSREHGAQIDLIIERADRLINLCEIKYSAMPYTVTKDEEMKVLNRVAAFTATTGAKEGVIPTFITTYGLAGGTHASIARAQVTMDDLFG